MHKRIAMLFCLDLWLLGNGIAQPARAQLAEPQSDRQSAETQQTGVAPNVVPPIDPLADPWTLLSKARSLISAGQPSAALQPIRDFISFRPFEPEGYFWQGLALEAQNNDDAALGSYREGIQQAAKTGMDSAELRLNAANILTKQGQLAEAVAEYRHAAVIDPTLATVQLNLGRALTLMNDPQAALECFQHCADLHYNPPQLSYYKAKALIKAGRTSEARTEILNLLSTMPQNNKTAQTIKEEFAQLLISPATGNFSSR